MRSRVTAKLWPTSSSVCSLPSPTPNRILMTFSSRARVSQLPQRLGLDLTDALAGDREALADFLERVLAAVADAEPHLDDLLFPSSGVSASAAPWPRSDGCARG